MKAAALAHLRALLARDRPVHGLWVTLESPSVTEMAVGLGLDWVVIDAEHGHLDWGDIAAHVRATVRSRTVCLVRISVLDHALIKRALDIGADGVVVPWMESPEQVRSAIAGATYPPHGRRGIGAERATAWGRCIAEHVAEAPGLLVVPIIESMRGGEQAKAMAQVPGIELFFVGPADWSATAGHAGSWEGGEVGARIREACEAIRSCGRHVGVIARDEHDLRARRAQGFRMLGLGIDGALLIRSLEAMLPATGQLQALATSLEPRQVGVAGAPLTAVPASLTPDRPARLVRNADAPRLELDDGVTVTSLVGGGTGARGMCASLVRFAPGGSLHPHRHPSPEMVVVVSGAILTHCGGQAHQLGPGDSIIIPAGVPHRTGNASSEVPALIHVAMPRESIARTLEDRAAWSAGGSATADIPGILRAAGEQVERLHSRSGGVDGGVRCVSRRIAAGAATAPLLHAVDCAVVVLAGELVCRTPAGELVARAHDALHLPRGAAYALQARGEAEVHLIETCADGVALDALVAEAVLAPATARAAEIAPPVRPSPASPPIPSSASMTPSATSSQKHQAMGYIARLHHDTPTRLWVNNPTPEEASRALALGVRSCTTNPTFAARMLGTLSAAERAAALSAARQACPGGHADEVDALQRHLVARILPIFASARRASDPLDGLVSIQGDPHRDTDAAHMLEEAERYAELGENIILKLPVTQAGLVAIEELLARGRPVLATEMMSVSQTRALCATWRRAQARGMPGVLVATHITGIYDQYLATRAQVQAPDLAQDALETAGMLVARRVAAVLAEEAVPIRLMGGGVRATRHVTEMVGGPVLVTANPDTLERIDAMPGRPLERFHAAADPAVVERLRSQLPDFRCAWDERGLTPEEFEHFGPVRFFLGMFIAGWDAARDQLRAAQAVGAP